MISCYFSIISSCREKALETLEKGSVFMVLPLLTRLRQICCHPGMFIHDYVEPTGKTEALADILEELKREGRKALVFSQFTSFFDILEKVLEAGKISYLRLDGGTPVEKRENLIDDFQNNDHTTFLISLKAGGTGLNLTAADTVIHMDPWWNESAEDQATARAYRIGQKSAVQVIRMIASGTIEEKVMKVKSEKKKMTDALIQAEETLLADYSAEEIASLLR